jgi:hypothetical protein
VPRIGTFEDDEENAVRPEGDIDLYVSKNPALTNLDRAAILAAEKSLSRGGTETIVYSNATPGVYYVGVKSEDQQTAEYGFLGVFSLNPFAQEDAQGNQTLRGFPSPAPIPDGTHEQPQGAYIFAISPSPLSLRKVIVTNNISHGLMGDLLGTLSHGRDFAVLNNHSPRAAVTNLTFIYDDTQEGNVAGARPTDGPGSLKSFGSKQGVGQWMLTEVDNADTHVGTNNWLRIFLEKLQDLGNGITVTIEPGGCRDDFIDVPIEGTNLTVTISVQSGTGPLLAKICRLSGNGDECRNTLITTGGQAIVIDKTTDPRSTPALI